MEDSPKRRYAYEAFQTVVPLETADALAAPELAQSVRCHDLSVQGISFFWPDEPDFEHLVISLGTAENPLWMRAEVVQSKAVYMHQDVQTLVGCRFTERYKSTSGMPEMLASAAEAFA